MKQKAGLCNARTFLWDGPDGSIILLSKDGDEKDGIDRALKGWERKNRGGNPVPGYPAAEEFL